MENTLKKCNITIGAGSDSPFMQKGEVYQDGNVAMCRDTAGKLWAIAGHSHMGHIGMFCGSCFSDLKEVYPIETSFTVGKAGEAYDGIRYPEYVCSRGSIWPFGLYICPNTHRFFCFFHNESGWNGHGTAYDALGLCETPRYDSDFRHIGLMHSDDEGRTWAFDRWVLSGDAICCSEHYIPEDQNLIPQRGNVINLGSGDFSIYTEPDGDYIYLFYNIIHVDIASGIWKSCDVYLARSRKRADGVMGDFVKYYDGAFCEAGNFGKETPIIRNCWHPSITYSTYLQEFVMAATPTLPDAKLPEVVTDIMELRTSKDLIHWSEPIQVEKDGKLFGNHYNTICSDSQTEQPYTFEKEALLLTCHNGTDVLQFPVTFGLQ